MFEYLNHATRTNNTNPDHLNMAAYDALNAKNNAFTWSTEIPQPKPEDYGFVEGISWTFESGSMDYERTCLVMLK